MDLRQKAQNRKLCIHAIAENVSPLASGKTFIANEKLKQEEAWNAGASLSFNIPVAGKELELNIDYYYTDFDNQMVLNPYSLNHENKYIIGNLSGKSQCRDFLEASWRHHWQIPGAQGHHHQVSASRQFVEQGDCRPSVHLGQYGHHPPAQHCQEARYPIGCRSDHLCHSQQSHRSELPFKDLIISAGACLLPGHRPACPEHFIESHFKYIHISLY